MENNVLNETVEIGDTFSSKTWYWGIKICEDHFLPKLNTQLLKFIYSERVTKFCEIFPLLLTVCTVVRSKRKISQNFVAFSEYMHFKNLLIFSTLVCYCHKYTFTMDIFHPIHNFTLLTLVVTQIIAFITQLKNQ